MAGPSDSVKMLALGRQFTIGTLYNYVEGVVLSNIRLWDPDDVARLAVTHNKTKEMVRVHTMAAEQQEDEYDELGTWMFDLGLDTHSAMSLTTGLVRPSCSGAWRFASDRANSTTRSFSCGAEVVVHCRQSSKKVSVDPTNSELEIICRQEKLSKATHVIVAITYGLEAFCVFSHQSDGSDGIAMKKMQDCAHFFADGLLDGRNRLELDQDEEGDEEDGGHCLVPPNLQCILYNDLISNKKGMSITSKPVADQYETCMKVLNQKSKFIPLKIWLYPLSKLLPSEAGIIQMPDKPLDVSHKLVVRCQRMWSRLTQIQREADLLKINKTDWIPETIRNRLNNFDELMTKFALALLKTLSEWTVSVRRGVDLEEENVAEMLEVIENNSPFAHKDLSNWLNHQRQHIKILETIVKLSGVPFVSKFQHLQKNIKTGKNGSFAVALHLPSLAGQDNHADEMNRFIEAFHQSTSSNWTKWAEKGKVASVSFDRRSIVNAVQEFSEWVTGPNSDTENVKYVNFYDERPSGQNLPILRLYDGSSGEPLSMNFSIPKAPGPVTIGKNHRGIITLNWTAEERTDFSSYLIQYRSIDGPEEIWNPIQHLSNTITIDYWQSEESYVFRVATVTQGGKSSFSPVSEEVTIDPVCLPPSKLKCTYVSDTSITMSWDHQASLESEKGFDNEVEEDCDDHKYSERKISSYSIECWMDGNQEPTFIQRSTTERVLTLEPLVLDTIYCIQVRAVCTDAKGSTFYGPACPILKIRTLEEPERAALIVHRVSQKSPVSNHGIDIYNLPLKKYRGSQTPGVGHYVFGEPSYSALVGKRRQRTILVLGATGSGKTTLINAMINFMMGIKWEDNFRFKLIDELTDKSQAHSQTDVITTYDLYEMKGSRLEYSLTVVDTPGLGDTKGLEKDKKIMEQIQEYFKCRHGIQQLEAVCFVVQSSLPRLTETQRYIFDSILSIFGNDIKNNIRLMVTFSDGAEPPVLAAVKEAGIPSPTDPVTGLPLHHKFNNSIFFTSNKKDRQTNEFNRTYFEMAVQGFAQFFDDLSRIEAKSLTLTREVLEERKRLEALVEGLQMRTQMKLTRVDEFQQIKKILTENKEQIEANKNFEFEVEFLVPKTTDISGTGQFTTNCQKCQMTCHFPCRQASDEDKHRCSVMSPNGDCMICKCSWNAHFNQKYRYEMVMEKVKRSSETLRQQYQTAKSDTLTNEQLLDKIQKEIYDDEKQLLELMEATSPHIRRLDEIALRPHSFSTTAYIDLMIETEKRDNRPGFKERIARLNKLRQMAEITAKLVRDQQISQAPPPQTIVSFVKHFLWNTNTTQLWMWVPDYLPNNVLFHFLGLPSALLVIAVIFGLAVLFPKDFLFILILNSVTAWFARSLLYRTQAMIRYVIDWTCKAHIFLWRLVSYWESRLGKGWLLFLLTVTIILTFRFIAWMLAFLFLTAFAIVLIKEIFSYVIGTVVYNVKHYWRQNPNRLGQNSIAGLALTGLSLAALVFFFTLYKEELIVISVFIITCGVTIEILEHHTTTNILQNPVVGHLTSI